MHDITYIILGLKCCITSYCNQDNEITDIIIKIMKPLGPVACLVWSWTLSLSKFKIISKEWLAQAINESHTERK